MDHRRKVRAEVIKPCMRTRSTLCTPVLKSFEPDESPEEDPRLVNWKRWLHERRKYQKRFHRITGRNPLDLSFNANERVRCIVETKELIEWSAVPIPAYHDKYRGNPSFWRTPDPVHGHGDDTLPPISVTMTKKELFLDPDITRVALPQLTRQERDLPDMCKRPTNWERGEYLKKRRDQLNVELSTLQNKDPEIDHLMIKGQKLCNEVDEITRNPVISIFPVENATILEDDPDEKIALRIQDRDFVLKPMNVKDTLSVLRLTEDVEDTDNNDDVNIQPFVWELHFKTYLAQNCERKICLENRGTRTINYRWRQITSESPLFRFLPKNRKFFSPFFFNKNDGRVFPGQVVEISVLFHTKSCRGASEVWRLETQPKIHVAEFHFRFSGFSLVSTFSNENKQSQKVAEYLNRRERDSFIRKMLEDLVCNFENPILPQVPYKSLFLERDIFEARNPSYHYHPSLISKFKAMYEEISKSDSVSWSLHLGELRAIVIRIADPELRQEKQRQFFGLCQLSLIPSLYGPPENTKSVQVYRVLCCFFNRFEAESDLVKDKCVVSRSKSKSNLRSMSTYEMEMYSSRGESTTDLYSRSSVTSFGSEMSNLYKELFFIRINCLLVETIEKACTVIDSFNNLHERDK